MYPEINGVVASLRPNLAPSCLSSVLIIRDGEQHFVLVSDLSGNTPCRVERPSSDRCKQSRAKKLVCGAHIRTKPVLRHTELLRTGPIAHQQQALSIFVVLVLRLPLVMIRRELSAPYRPASKTGAPDTEGTRKTDEQEIQEPQEIKVNAGQQY